MNETFFVKVKDIDKSCQVSRDFGMPDERTNELKDILHKKLQVTPHPSLLIQEMSRYVENAGELAWVSFIVGAINEINKSRYDDYIKKAIVNN